MFALTQEDKELLLPLSGRDPLGVLPVWQHRARDVVPHLTAASRHAAGFQVLLTALAWWPEFQRRYRRPPIQMTLYFLLVEQAFARSTKLLGQAWPLPGNRRLNSSAPGVWIGLRPDAHLLDSQLPNGVWGLYRGPAISARLIDAENRVDEALAGKVLRDTSAILGLFPSIDKLLKAPKQEGIVLAERSSSGLARALSTLVAKPPLRDKLKEIFLEQTAITRSIAPLARDFDFARGTGVLAAEAMENIPDYQETFHKLMRCEHYLASLETCFEFLCGVDDAQVASAARALEGFLKSLRYVRDEFILSGNYAGLAKERMEALAAIDLERGDLFVKSLVVYHENVSDARRNEPWIVIEGSGKLDVRRHLPPTNLDSFNPTQAWRNSYYLDALGTLTAQVAPRMKRA